MVTCAYCHTHLVDNGTQIVGMHTLNDERNQTATLLSLTYETNTFYLGKLLDGRL